MDANNINFVQSISLNNRLGGITTTGTEYYRAANVHFTHCVIWDYPSINPGSSVNYLRGLSDIVNHCTFGISGQNSSGIFSFNSYDRIPGGGDNNSKIINSVIYNHKGGTLFYDIETYDYNDLYLNDLAPALAAHDKSVNPIWNAASNPTGGLKYITRIESGSNLSGIANDGGDIGANVKTLIGVSGTLWGDSGYNTDTGVSMWPFPNEDIIRANMKAYNAGGVSGNRGFCVDGQTLTKYIWQYLGNPIPAEIYGSTGLSITSTSLPQGTVGAAYATSLSASGGTTPYTWTLQSGTLPAGLSLNSSNGLISGTPTAGGMSSFTVRVTDAASATATKSLSVTIVNSADTTAPAAINTASAATGASAGQINLNWTAPGDDGTSGTAAAYTIKYAASAITTDAQFNSATTVSGAPQPAAGGTAQSITVGGLTPGSIYYFAIKTQDEVPNVSVLSNSPSAVAKTSVASDTTAPAAITNLSATTGSSAGQINVSWKAPGDDGSTGTAAAYTIKYSTSAITSDTLFNAATSVTGVPTPAAAGTTQTMTIAGLTPGGTYYFAIKTRDESSNLSPLSNSPSAVAKTTTPSNNPPTLNPIGNKAGFTGTLLQFSIAGTDPDGGTLTYSATGLPSGATFAGQAFSWTPSAGQTGNFNITFTVTDAAGASDSKTITIGIQSQDIQPPYVDGMNPGNDEVQVSRNTNILFHIKDTGKGVDINTISMKIQREGDSATTDIIVNGTSQLSSYPNSVTIKGTPVDYLVVYTPPYYNTQYNFKYEQLITVTISAKDLAGNALTAYSYSFTTAMIIRGPNRKVSR